MLIQYNFSGTDLNLWKMGIFAFGVSRYTGGDSERVMFDSNWVIWTSWKSNRKVLF